MTVGGDSASEIADLDTFSTASLIIGAIYILANPAGTSETVGICSRADQQHGDLPLQVNNLNSAAAIATNGAFSTNASSITLSVDTNAGGIAVGICNTNSGAQTVAWTGAE